MYKTVRQGENSLQYTILPQTEELLSNSGGKGKGRDYSPSNQSRRVSKKLVFYYLAVFLLGLLLIFGAVLVVLLLMGILPADLPSQLIKPKHETWLGQSSRLIAADLSEKNQSKKKELSSDTKSLKETTTQSVTTQSLYNTTTPPEVNGTHSSADITAPVSIVASNTSTLAPQSSTIKQEWIMPALKRLQLSTVAPTAAIENIKVTTTKTADKMSSLFPTHQRESNTDLMLGHDPINWTDYDDDDDEDYDITRAATTATSDTKKPPLMINKSLATKVKSTKQTVPDSTSSSPVVVASVNSTVTVLESINNMILGKNKNKTKVYTKFMETKERILDDDDEDYKEPLADEDDVSVQGTGSDDVKMSQTKSSWLQTRWPFVDPSSYFQWTDYSARDNLLLPAILSAAVSALLVLAVLCYALRRRQRCKRRIQEIGNLTSDLQAEDNAILLTAENPSEDD